ncbi:Hypothetical protein AKI40_0671 [Enterobacter sp. FY-07]|nr:Hypothetical protein AKI40_0671 [Enterobacter sp. FY-07]
MRLIFLQPAQPLCGNGYFPAPALFITDGDQLLILQKIQCWIDNTSAWRVVALRQGFNLFNQLITVAGVVRQQVQNNQPQFAMTKKALAAAATVVVPLVIVTVMMPHTPLLLFDISNLYLKLLFRQYLKPLFL